MNHENLWAPWRSVYLRELSRKAEGAGWDEVSAGDFLAEYWAHPERDDADWCRHVYLRRRDDGTVETTRGDVNQPTDQAAA